MKRLSLISAVEDVLLQGRLLLRAVNREVYGRKDGENGSIGAHYRHVLDHFLCLLEGIENGEVNYDHRRRSPELENSLEAALFATNDLMQRFRALPEDALERECAVIYSVGYGQESSTAVPSNGAREIAFCVGHAIHHYAILKLLCSGTSLALPYEFGVAPSTLKHHQAQAAH